MATIQEMIVEKLVAELSEKTTLSAPKISALRELLRKDSKVRADDLVAIFIGDDGEVA
jgi:hypothetical protein